MPDVLAAHLPLPPLEEVAALAAQDLQLGRPCRVHVLARMRAAVRMMFALNPPHRPLSAVTTTIRIAVVPVILQQRMRVGVRARVARLFRTSIIFRA
jgi:hypothetical protein